MNTRIADLQCREVINVCNGERLGYINDVELDINTGRLVAIVVPGQWSISSLFSKGDEYVIPWNQIEKIGGDIILVRCETPLQPRKPRSKKKFFI